QKMNRHPPGWRRKRARIGRQTDADLNAAVFHQLKTLRLLAELGAGILIDQYRPAAQFLELVGEKIAGDAIPGGFWLVIGKAIMLYLLRHCSGDPSGGEDPKRNPAYCIACCRHLLSLSSFFRALPMCNTYYRRPTMVIVACNAPVYGAPNIRDTRGWLGSLRRSWHNRRHSGRFS